MATFTMKLTQAVMVEGEYFDAGLSVQISSFFGNPWNEPKKIEKAFLRVHGLQLVGNNWNYLNQAYLTY